MKVAALIPAAGEGLRLGHGPKALVTVAGETLLNRAVKAFAGLVDEVIVAIAPTMQEGSNFSDARFVSGGATRQESVYNLLRATDADFVLIHDAARPFLSRRTIEEVIAAVKVHDAVSVVTTVADTLIEAKTGHVIDRQRLRAVQTPQCFRRELVLAAHEHALRSANEATDDAALVRAFGHKVALAHGSSWLMKVTTQADLELAEALATVWGRPMLDINAYAKVNLGLSVLGRRTDGFHELDTLMVRLELHDTVTLRAVEAGVSLELTGADLDISPEQNLAYRAAELYLREAAVNGGVELNLEKRIPVAAGLGGGSADAGAVLRGLAQIYPSDVDILPLAAQLGSDVPFFTAALGGARATGRGEGLEPISVPELHLVLVNPGMGVSAGDAYGRLQKLTEPLELDTILRRLERNGEPDYFNALESGVVGLEPVIGEVLAVLRQTGLKGVLMSGSGSTCFGLAAAQHEAQLLAATLQEAYPEWWVLATHTL